MGLIGFGMEIYKSIKIDENTYHQYQKTYRNQAAAAALIENRRLKADQALTRTANRKKGILATSMDSFLECYRKIIKINFIPSDQMMVDMNRVFSPDQIMKLESVIIQASKPLEDKAFLWEMVKGSVFSIVTPFKSGLGSAAVADSKRNMSIARNARKASEVTMAHAETAAVALEAIAEGADKISELLSKLNLLFMKSITYTNDIIDERGFERKNYNADDRKALMTCMNLAKTIKGIIDSPVIDADNNFAKESIRVIETGNELIRELNYQGGLK